jgi:hypothetical protein
MIRMPIVKLELEDMRHSMLHALNERHEDIKRALHVGIDNFLLTLPQHLAREMERLSHDIASEAMRAALEEYWNSGPGREQIDATIAAKFSGGKK